MAQVFKFGGVVVDPHPNILGGNVRRVASRSHWLQSDRGCLTDLDLMRTTLGLW